MYLLRLTCLMFFLLGTGTVAAENRLKEFISLHNQERESLGLTPLEWSDELVASALDLAEDMALEDKHLKGESGYGENSWSGPEGSVTFEEMFQIWSRGKELFLAEKPVPLNCSQNWEQCSSYSQIVWADTTHMGCAAVASLENDYIVCHYSPAGNIQDQTAY